MFWLIIGLIAGVLIGRRRRIGITEAMNRLSQAMRKYPDLAHGWYCNLYMAMRDAGADPDEAAARTSDFMHNAFGVRYKDPYRDPDEPTSLPVG